MELLLAALFPYKAGNSFLSAKNLQVSTAKKNICIFTLLLFPSQTVTLSAVENSRKNKLLPRQTELL